MKKLLTLFILISFILILNVKIISKEIIITPIEYSNFSHLTNYEDMMYFLMKISSRKKSIVKLNIIGKSVEGKEIPALFFSENNNFNKNKRIKPIVFIFCQQHGNEPSGKEAALLLIRDLTGKYKLFLKDINIIIVPQVNVDGGEKGTRKNANNMDLNRNHLILSEPESLAIHKLFLKWKPEVTLDVHEYNTIKGKAIKSGYIKDADEMLGGVTNLNIDKKIRDFSENIIKETGYLIKSQNYTFSNYIVGNLTDRFRYSTTNINDGRQSMGIYNTFSFILEGKRYGDLITNLEKRTKAQYISLVSFLKTIIKNREQIIYIVKKGRDNLIRENNGKIIGIKMDYYINPSKKGLDFPVFDLFKWKHTVKRFNHFYSAVKIKKSIILPFGYIFHPDNKNLLKILIKHKIKIYKTINPVKVLTEKYKILHITPAIEEEKPDKNVDLISIKENKIINHNYLIIPLNQPASILIPLLLEPQSSWGLVSKRSGRKYNFGKYLKEGSFYPIERLVSPVALDKLQIIEYNKIHE